MKRRLWRSKFPGPPPRGTFGFMSRHHNTANINVFPRHTHRMTTSSNSRFFLVRRSSWTVRLFAYESVNIETSFKMESVTSAYLPHRVSVSVKRLFKPASSSSEQRKQKGLSSLPCQDGYHYCRDYFGYSPFVPRPNASLVIRPLNRTLATQRLPGGRSACLLPPDCFVRKQTR